MIEKIQALPHVLEDPELLLSLDIIPAGWGQCDFCNEYREEK